MKGPVGVKIIINHEHSLRHYHSRLPYSVKSARGGVGVKERGVVAVKKSGAVAVRKREVEKVRSRAGE